ncbi:hypothetical protein [Branchiibius sp. NY16-3462-2]|uniref:hypothetical protein n=1 Tax=Branchiibius sp. NY16-3462-2 TaxID=1807500 RepID=UPI00079B0183|nr:hypothetical protein [Branchiibius sp. NY16-3462-2]KYH45622.1 hypothetical protein AZH51_18045 [Branchiibius sp. NY16-3462-2]
MTGDSFSQQVDAGLDDLRDYINYVLDSYSSAEQENHEQVQARIAEAAGDTEQKADELKAKVDAGSSEASAHLHEFSSTLADKKAEFEAKVAERGRQHDARQAQRAADISQAYAEDAVVFARVAIQNAWVAILDALDAKLYVRELADQTTAGAHDA